MLLPAIRALLQSKDPQTAREGHHRETRLKLLHRSAKTLPFLLGSEQRKLDTSRDWLTTGAVALSNVLGCIEEWSKATGVNRMGGDKVMLCLSWPRLTQVLSQVMAPTPSTDVNQLSVCRLPKSVLCLCFSYLPISDRAPLYLTCKTFHSAAQEHSSLPPNLIVTDSNMATIDGLFGSLHTTKRKRLQEVSIRIRDFDPFKYALHWLSMVQIRKLHVSSIPSSFSWATKLSGMNGLEGLEELSVLGCLTVDDQAEQCNKFFARCSSLTSFSSPMEQLGSCSECSVFLLSDKCVLLRLEFDTLADAKLKLKSLDVHVFSPQFHFAPSLSKLVDLESLNVQDRGFNRILEVSDTLKVLPKLRKLGLSAEVKYSPQQLHQAHTLIRDSKVQTYELRSAMSYIEDHWYHNTLDDHTIAGLAGSDHLRSLSMHFLSEVSPPPHHPIGDCFSGFVPKNNLTELKVTSEPIHRFDIDLSRKLLSRQFKSYFSHEGKQIDREYVLWEPLLTADGLQHMPTHKPPDAVSHIRSN